ncbi:MAG: LytTR family transcriptional regulator [Chitinophagaceae bacterium]|nr:MAG: LytTR family transcriptional regulator [Chitinophagaceae bacterium]
MYCLSYYFLLVSFFDRLIRAGKSISSLEKLLSPHRFIRIHRSYIVTIGKIDSFNPTHVSIGDFQIPIGRLYKGKVEDVLRK